MEVLKMISINNVSKKFVTNDGDFQAVSSVHLDIDEGDIYGIIGFSGAGKSTLLRMINLLERPDSGDIIVDGENILSLPRKELLKKRKTIDRKSTRLNSSHVAISYAVFCLKKKTNEII